MKFGGWIKNVESAAAVFVLTFAVYAIFTSEFDIRDAIQASLGWAVTAWLLYVVWDGTAALIRRLRRALAARNEPGITPSDVEAPHGPQCPQ